MLKTPPLSGSADVQAWLSQFKVADQGLAANLLDSMILVSADDLRNRLFNLIRNSQASVGGRVGLYVERELEREGGYGPPERLFSEPLTLPRRAFGKGPPPIVPAQSDVGSEGILAQLVSELCRVEGSPFVNHPGPDDIRRNRIRALFIVTDFIGSGQRALTYLDALWRCHSLRSWWSLKLVELQVIAYSATEGGLKAVRRHRSRPTVEIIRTCPTIWSEFDAQKAAQITALCEAYDPSGPPSAHSVGFNGGGTLLAFAHGIPDNAPPFLHQSGSGGLWTPLFPSRVTYDARQTFKDELSKEQIFRRLSALNQGRLAASPRLWEASSSSQLAVLVLAALRKAPRNEETVASRTGLTIPEVRTLLKTILENNLVNERLLVTEAGYRELKHYRGPRESAVAPIPQQMRSYYPKNLRSPRK